MKKFLTVVQILALLGVVILALASHGFSEAKKSAVDPFSGSQTISERGLKTAKVKGMSDSSSFLTDLSVMVAAVKVSDGTVLYSIRFDLMNADFGNPWIFINDGASLTVLIDGRRRTFSTLGAPKREVETGMSMPTITESIIYGMTRKDLEDIARARDVSFKLQGERGRIIRAFQAKGLTKVGDFLARTKDFDGLK